MVACARLKQSMKFTQMKRSCFYSALVVVVTAVSCMQEMAPESVEGTVRFEASFGALSKAVLEPGATESKVSWEAGDEVGILTGGGQLPLYC